MNGADGQVIIDVVTEYGSVEKAFDTINKTISDTAGSAQKDLDTFAKAFDLVETAVVSAKEELTAFASDASDVKVPDIEISTEGLEVAKQHLDELNSKVEELVALQEEMAKEESSLPRFFIDGILVTTDEHVKLYEAIQQARSEYSEFAIEVRQAEDALALQNGTIDKNKAQFNALYNELIKLSGQLNKAGLDVYDFDMALDGTFDTADIKKMNAEQQKLAREYNNTARALDKVQRQTEGVADSASKGADAEERLGKSAKGTVSEFDAQAKAVGEVSKSLEQAARNAEKHKITLSVDGVRDAVREYDRLNAVIVNLENQIESLQAEYDRVASSKGNTSDEALKLEKRILALQGTMQKASREADSFGAALDDAQRVMNDSSTEADNLRQKSEGLGQGLNEAGRGASSLDVALGVLVAQGIQRAIDKLGQLADKTFELRRQMSYVEQSARDFGFEMEFVDEVMAEFAITTSDTNQIIEATSNLMASGFDENQMLEAMEAITGAAVRFPDTFKVDQLASSLQRTIASGQAVGEFSKLLKSTGIDVEEFNRQMAAANSEAQRQQIVLRTLSRTGLAEARQGYIDMNGDLVEASQAQHEYNMALAELGAAWQPVATAILKVLTPLVNLLASLPEGAIAVIAVLGLLAIAVAKVTKSLGFMNLGFGGMKKSAGEATAAAQQVNMKFLSMAAGIALVAAAVAIIIFAIAELVNAFTDSDQSAMEVAKAIAVVVAVAVGAVGVLAALGMAAQSASGPLIMFAIAVLAIAAAVSLLVVALALLIALIRGVPPIQINYSVPETPTVGQLTSNASKGYAKGTASASRGWHLVGENGPEMRYFSGGEQVLTSAQTMARTGAIGSQRSITNVYNVKEISIPADSVRSFVEVVEIMEGEANSIRQGVI